MEKTTPMSFEPSMEKHGDEKSMENNKDVEKIDSKDDEEVVKYGGIKAMPFIIGNEAFEKLGTLGSATNLVVYLSAVFNMTTVAATTVVNVFNGTASLSTLFGGFLSDAYFGRYKTLGFACVASFLGMVVLMLTAAFPNLHPPKCEAHGTCVGPTPWQFAFLLSGFGFLILGAGGIRPCNLAFGADQFNPNTESGKRGINSFFNWYYLTYTFAVMVSVTVIVYIQSDVSWTIGLGVPAGLMFVSCVLFFAGKGIYVIVKPEGSPLTSVVQVIVACIKKRRIKLPQDPASSLFNYVPPKSINSRLSHTEQFRCLDKAAVVTSNDKINLDGSSVNPWRLCSLQQVEEVKCLARIMPIWASTILYHVALNQQQSYVVFQALQMDRRLGSGSFKMPAATYIIFTMLSLTIWIPIWDRLIVPLLERLTGKEGGLTVLTRIALGNILGILCTFLSGWIENERRHIALTSPMLGLTKKGSGISSMSAMLLVPQLALAGISEAFCYVALVEFFYKQFPENMRSVAGAAFPCGRAIANYLNGFLISIVHKTTVGTKTGDWLPDDLNKGKLDYFYYVIGSLGIVNFAYFLVCAKWYRYKEVGDNAVEMSTESKKSVKHHV